MEMDIQAQREDSGARVEKKASDNPNNSEMGEKMISVVQRNKKVSGHGNQHHLRLLGLPLGRTHMNYPI